MSTKVSIMLLENGSATGDSKVWPGGEATLTMTSSNWNGATAALHQLGADDSTYQSVGSDAEMTANGKVNVTLEEKPVKLVITGNPTGVYARLGGTGR